MPLVRRVRQPDEEPSPPRGFLSELQSQLTPSARKQLREYFQPPDVHQRRCVVAPVQHTIRRNRVDFGNVSVASCAPLPEWDCSAVPSSSSTARASGPGVVFYAGNRGSSPTSSNLSKNDQVDSLGAGEFAVDSIPRFPMSERQELMLDFFIVLDSSTKGSLGSEELRVLAALCGFEVAASDEAWSAAYGQLCDTRGWDKAVGANLPGLVSLLDESGPFFCDAGRLEEFIILLCGDQDDQISDDVQSSRDVQPHSSPGHSPRSQVQADIGKFVHRSVAETERSAQRPTTAQDVSPGPSSRTHLTDPPRVDGQGKQTRCARTKLDSAARKARINSFLQRIYHEDIVHRETRMERLKIQAVKRLEKEAPFVPRTKSARDPSPSKARQNAWLEVTQRNFEDAQAKMSYLIKKRQDAEKSMSRAQRSDNPRETIEEFTKRIERSMYKKQANIDFLCQQRFASLENEMNIVHKGKNKLTKTVESNLLDRLHYGPEERRLKRLLAIEKERQLTEDARDWRALDDPWTGSQLHSGNHSQQAPPPSSRRQPRQQNGQVLRSRSPGSRRGLTVRKIWQEQLQSPSSMSANTCGWGERWGPSSCARISPRHLQPSQGPTLSSQSSGGGWTSSCKSNFTGSCKRNDGGRGWTSSSKNNLTGLTKSNYTGWAETPRDAGRHAQFSPSHSGSQNSSPERTTTHHEVERIGRQELVREIFALLADEGEVRLGSEQLEMFMRLCGFTHGEDKSWEETYRVLEFKKGWDRKGGINLQDFEELINEKNTKYFCPNSALQSLAKVLRDFQAEESDNAEA